MVLSWVENASKNQIFSSKSIGGILEPEGGNLQLILPENARNTTDVNCQLRTENFQKCAFNPMILWLFDVPRSGSDWDLVRYYLHERCYFKDCSSNIIAITIHFYCNLWAISNTFQVQKFSMNFPIFLFSMPFVRAIDFLFYRFLKSNLHISCRPNTALQ